MVHNELTWSGVEWSEDRSLDGMEKIPDGQWLPSLDTPLVQSTVSHHH